MVSSICCQQADEGGPVKRHSKRGKQVTAGAPAPFVKWIQWMRGNGIRKKYRREIEGCGAPAHPPHHRETRLELKKTMEPDPGNKKTCM